MTEEEILQEVKTKYLPGTEFTSIRGNTKCRITVDYKAEWDNDELKLKTFNGNYIGRVFKKPDKWAIITKSVEPKVESYPIY